MKAARLGLSACLAAGLFAADAAGVVTSRPPNIIIILADDLGYNDLGCQGSPDVRSPNIDRLAQEGVRCTAGYTTAPQCTPSRAGMLTGMPQSRFGVETVISSPYEKFAEDMRWGIPHGIKLLPEYLKPFGYTTACIGKWHLGYSEDHNPINRGFDYFNGFLHGGSYFLKGEYGIPILNGKELVKFDKDTYLTEYLTDRAVDYIAQNKSRPFFLYLAHFAPHVPLQAPQPYLDRFSAVEDSYRRSFLAMVSALDDGVGRVVQILAENHLEENTLIFFTSDNGGPTGHDANKGENTSRNDPLSGVKGDLLEGGIRVPYIVRWTGHLPAGTVYKAPVSTLDFAATSVTLAGGVPEKQLEGVDLIPYLSGSKPPLRDRTLYWRFGIELAMRRGDCKLFRPYPGVGEFVNIEENFNEDPAKRLKPEEFAERYGEMDRALTEWNRGLAAPIWKNFFPEVVDRMLERHGYKGYESYKPGVSTLDETKRKWEITRILYKENTGADLDSPKVLSKDH